MAAVGLLTLVVAACGGGASGAPSIGPSAGASGSPTAAPSSVASGAIPDPLPAKVVVTIGVLAETYKVLLDTPQTIRHAYELYEGMSEEGTIPLGKIVRGSPDVNAPWSWHIDPATFEWADVTTEVCDGLPSYVEDGSLTSDTYCPWSAEILAIDPA